MTRSGQVAKMPAVESPKTSPVKANAGILASAIKRSPKKTMVRSDERANKLRAKYLGQGVLQIQAFSPNHPAKKAFWHNLVVQMDNNPVEYDFLGNPVILESGGSQDLLRDDAGFYHKGVIVANPLDTAESAHQILIKHRNWLNRNGKFNITWIIPEDWQMPDSTRKLSWHLSSADMHQFLVNVYGIDMDNGFGHTNRVLPENWAAENPEELEKWVDTDTIADCLGNLLEIAPPS